MTRSAQYRTAMASFAGMKNLDVWYSHLDIEKALAEFGSQFKPKTVKRTEKTLAKARTKDSMAAFSKLTARRRRAGADRRPVAADRADRPARGGRGPR